MGAYLKSKRKINPAVRSRHAELSKSDELDVMEFMQAIGLLVRRARTAAGSQELSLTESMVMSRLSKQGPATTADLARAEGVRPQSMRTTIAILEELGMVERAPHPTDGRQVYIQLTSRGIAKRKTEKAAKLTWLSQAISTLSPEDRKTIFAAGEIVKRLVEL
jgi:DNA-binding MarR family transcriptional regulator